MEVNVMGSKQTIKWNPADMPTIPVLTNKKAIKKHTLLKVFLAQQSKDKK